MKLLYYFFILISLFPACLLAQEQQLSAKLPDGTYPVIFKVNLLDKKKNFLEGEIWIRPTDGSEDKIFLEKVEKGKFLKLLSNSENRDYEMGGSIGNIDLQIQVITVPKNTKKQQIFSKDFAVDITEDEIGAPKPVTLRIKIYDDKRNLVDGEIKIVDLDDREFKGLRRVEKGIYEAEFLNQKAQEYNISVSENNFLYENIMSYIPAANDRPQVFEEEFFVKVTSKPAVAQNKKKEEPKKEQVAAAQLGGKDALPLPAPGKRVVLRNVYFGAGSAVLQPASYEALDQLHALLLKNPSLKIEIAGHTDNIGNPATNRALSQRRAEAVVLYLLKKGIARERLRAVGYGDEKPIATNDDEKEGRELNRRIDFVILED
jgi:outer membrane protein OmpA-like peptidoglycan-associated protein